MALIVTRVSELEQGLRDYLEREQATPDQGCSALANALLHALVKAKRDPRVTAQVASEMRRLAAKINELAAVEGDTLSRALADAVKH